MWEEILIDTEHGQFEVFKKGNGRPLSVTHLYSEYNKNGNLLANSFTDKYSVYLINLAGCGKSTESVGEDKYSMESSVKDLEAIRKELGFESWGFAGHSTGGMLGLKYAIQSPESLDRIIVGGLSASADYMKHPGSIYCSENPNNKRLREIFAVLRDVHATIEERRAVSKEWMMMSLYNKSAYDEMISRPNSGKTVSARLDYYSYKELPNYDLRPFLKEVEVPAYIYAGLHDAQCPYDFGVEAANLLPNSTFKAFNQSNHNPFIEEEAEFKKFVESII
ncbi:alpha/beta fold hydrolase [Fredinandcohnia quinoae]|uniref:Alpha/beta hydrolase n=1 Tax=Fredinandcohnia quinoae TaxID=2918902 RepID=A0AAW5EBY3_9BACI|nr:alpha/beta hydrolase [Fredinandcohnia sp. SECRCQ15]MCH1627175.1 alpha/beta hydrolase [Fredinandcohnia sp. SECRCQ15]